MGDEESFQLHQWRHEKVTLHERDDWRIRDGQYSAGVGLDMRGTDISVVSCIIPLIFKGKSNVWAASRNLATMSYIATSQSK